MTVTLGKIFAGAAAAALISIGASTGALAGHCDRNHDHARAHRHHHHCHHERHRHAHAAMTKAPCAHARHHEHHARMMKCRPCDKR